MKKDVYYRMSGSSYFSDVICKLKDIESHIQNDIESLSDDEVEDAEYTVTPVWMTEEEFNNLPEHE